MRAVSKVKTINKFRVKRSVSDFGLPKKEDGHPHALISSERDKWFVNIIYMITQDYFIKIISCCSTFLLNLQED